MRQVTSPLITRSRSSLCGLAYSDSVDLKGILTGADRWSFKPAVASLLTVAALALVCQLPGTVSFFLIPLSLLGYAIASVVIVATAVFCALKRRPRRGASILLVLLLPVLLWQPVNWAADLVHLGLTVGLGAGQIGESSDEGTGDLVAYDWSVGLAGGPNRFLIHDVTDEIALPAAQHAHPLSSEKGFGEDCAGRVHRLAKHYYVCMF